jgi:phage baseplate assembly protein V
VTDSGTLDRLFKRLQLLVGRGRIKVSNDGGAVQSHQVQLSPLELKDVARAAEYGFTSMPQPGCHAVVIFVGGDRSNGIIVATNDQAHRLKNLQPGEVAIYDDQGQSVYITRSGIVVNGGGKQVTITNTPKVRVESNIEATGTIKDLCDSTGKTMDGMRTTYDGHDHNDPQGGVVGTPNQLM